MEGQQQAASRKQLVGKPVYKFLIGLVGGLCAALFPRLMAALALQDSSDVVLLSTGYLYIATLFAALIGVVVMIMEWNVSKRPSATFMTALGIPALIAGALNTSNGAYVLDAKSKENLQLAEVVQSLSQIPEVSYDNFTPLGDAGGTIKSTNPLALNIIGVAYAANGSNEPEKFNLNPSMKIQQQQYYIILDQSPGDEAGAKLRAEELKADVPNAQAVKAGDKYLVIDPKALPKSEAVLEGIRLKEKGLHPALLPKK